jgi:Sigma-70, region 4/Putative zinc-finger
MASFESLPPDQRAVLELVLRRGRSYDEIAKLLSIDRAGVRARALEALDALGPQTSVSSERRALITDYLLGALPARIAEEVRDHLAGSPAERAWARVVAGELRTVASRPLPEIPNESARTTARAPAPAPTAPADQARRRASPADAGRSSRRGGAVLLGGVGAVVVAVVLVLVLSGGGGGKHKLASSRTTTSRTTSTTPSTSTSTTAQVIAQINLDPPSGGKARGIAEVLREKGKIGIAIVADGLAANSTNPPNAYAVWLSNSSGDSEILGFVDPGVGKNGRLQTAGGLPSNASHYHKLLVTLETQSKPKTPGRIVLEGTASGL